MDNQVSDWKKSLFAQSGLVEIYIIAKDNYHKSKFNSSIVKGAFFITLIFLIWISTTGYKNYTVSSSYDFAMKCCEYSSQMTMSILGFLISGFAIFSSFSKPELFIRLAQIAYPKNQKNLSRLHYILANFLNVFTIFLTLLSISSFSLIAFSANSPIHFLIEKFLTPEKQMKITVNYFVGSMICILILQCFLSLKSFIWNMYQTVLITVADEGNVLEQKKDRQDSV